MEHDYKKFEEHYDFFKNEISSQKNEEAVYNAKLLLVECIEISKIISMREATRSYTSLSPSFDMELYKKMDVFEAIIRDYKNAYVS